MMRWIAQLGFTGVVLGPAGITSQSNPSPYDATALSRNPLHIALGPLVEQGLLKEDLLKAAVEHRPANDRVVYDYAWKTQRQLLASVADCSPHGPASKERTMGDREFARWLRSEADFEGITAAVGHDNFQDWPATPPVQTEAADLFLLSQQIVHQQHADFRQHCRRLGLRVWADLPVGTSHRDRYLLRGLFLPGYAMGAPPSRTNPEGQPWGYPILDPEQLQPRGGAWHYVMMRLDALLRDHDGLRIDHPHGWVCPWVYRTDDPDPLHAVQHGARLYESPDLPNHPALAAYARIRSDQIDPAQPRYADHWVRDIEPVQVDQYARLFDLIVERIQAYGRDPNDSMVEVLSTCPRPLAEVLARHHMGRYRVTQKANLENRHDVYRTDCARAEDWVMVGNHDTPPLRAVIDQWDRRGKISLRANYLASRLSVDAQEYAILQHQFVEDPCALATAMFADLFCGPARNVLIFWVDLFGSSEVYNRPGIVDGANWSLRVPVDFERACSAARKRREAPDLAQALAWALHAKGLDQDAEGKSLAAALLRGSESV